VPWVRDKGYCILFENKGALLYPGGFVSYPGLMEGSCLSQRRHSRVDTFHLLFVLRRFSCHISLQVEVLIKLYPV
jgi:hypothetical protein